MSSWGADAPAEPADDAFGASDAFGAPDPNEAGEDGADAAAAENLSLKFATLTLSKEEFRNKAVAKGWTETTAYDYGAFQEGFQTGSHGASQKYEWNDEYGDVAPKIPDLERILFGGEFQVSKGKHMENLPVEVALDSEEKVAPISTFDDAGLHPVILENIKLAQYSLPTPIQRYTIPAVLQGKDVVAIAQTGSGKTAAYMIPTLSKLMGKAKKLRGPRPSASSPKVRAEPLVVIVVPTRELAMQIFDEARRMCYRSMLRPCVTYGGRPYADTMDDLAQGCEILIATPGRLTDLMDKPHVLTMSRVKYTIIDEADEMLNTDWSEALAKIMGGGDTNDDADHVYMMFSATFPKGARQMAREYMSQSYVRIRIGRAGQAHKNIRQNILYVDKDQKRECVYDLLFSMEDPGRTIIFCNFKSEVDLVDDFLYNRGIPSTSIHSDRNQCEREDAMRAFRQGKAPVLVATGVSARGWDVKDVKHIINYDLPSCMYGGITEYIHRIGRTARIGHQGLATSLYNERNEDIAQGLVNTLVECDCEIPEFLQHLVPENTQEIDFGDDSEDEIEGEDGFGGGDAGGAAAVADDSGFAADGAVPPADW